MITLSPALLAMSGSELRGVMPFAAAFVLLAIGLYAVVAKRNLIKIIIGLLIADYAVNLFLVLMSYRPGKTGVTSAPIITEGSNAAWAGLFQNAADPLPQAMILTSIVIGLGIVALVVSVAIRLYQRYGTFDITEIRRLRG